MSPSSDYPLVSVITVCFNAERTIERTLISVAQQTYPNIEYIIIDGGSTDGTLALVEKYKALVTYFVSERDCGIYDAMNKGIKVARGEIIGILNADDFYSPHAIELVMKAFRADTALDFVSGNCATVNASEMVIRVSTPFINFDRKVVSVPHPSTFVSRRCYLNHGVFDDSLRYSGDYDFFCRLAKAGARYALINATLAHYRVGGFGSFVGFIAEREALVIKCRYWGLLSTVNSTPYIIYLFVRRKVGFFLRRYGIMKAV